MYGWERHVLLRHYLEQGLSVTAIAEQVQVDRRTIHRWIQAGDVDRDPIALVYGPRLAVPTKLDPYRPLIDARLHTYPALTAVRLYEEVRAAGYPGSLTQLKAYVRQVRPVPPPEPLIRFETAPGHQGQVGTSPRSDSRGGSATRSSWCSGTPASSGCSSTRSRRWPS